VKLQRKKKEMRHGNADEQVYWCHGDKRRNNPRFSRFSCIDEDLRLKRKERRKQ
jgi:hypothetical protein